MKISKPDLSEPKNKDLAALTLLIALFAAIVLSFFTPKIHVVNFLVGIIGAAGPIYLASSRDKNKSTFGKRSGIIRGILLVAGILGYIFAVQFDVALELTPVWTGFFAVGIGRNVIDPITGQETDIGSIAEQETPTI